MDAMPRVTTSSRVTSGGQRLTHATPNAEIRLTEADVRDPKTLQRILMQLVLTNRELSRAFRGSPRLCATTFEGLKFVAATAYKIQHAYGTQVRYAIVGWQGAAGLPLPPWTTNDGTSLIIVPDVSGTADLEVWPV